MSGKRKVLVVLAIVLLLVAAGFTVYALRDKIFPNHIVPPSVCWDGKVFYYYQGPAELFEGTVLGSISSVTSGKGDASVHGEARNFQPLSAIGDKISGAKIGFWQDKYWICFTDEWYQLTEK